MKKKPLVEDESTVTLALYRAMRTQDLQQLCRAFEMDLLSATKAETVAFCRLRIRLIQQIIGERQKKKGARRR